MSRSTRLVVALALTLAAAGASAATRYDPRLRFRTISTARFDIHFHQGEEVMARRLARLAEEVARTLDRSLGPASGRVQVILVDQNDLPNGWATPLPYNTIEISAASPVAESLIGNADDWMRLVFTHEYVHIVHLSRRAGWIGGLRRVFGRLPVLYPNLFQPIWQIEGIATWQESAQTGGGRVPAGDFRLFLQRGAAETRLEPLDRASGRLVDWPSGNTPYVYGAYFHQYLEDTYGADALRRLTDETARRPPYFGSLAFRKVFGRSLGRLWNDFEASVPPSPTTMEAERLTRHGFYVSGPRFGEDGRLFYSVFDPHRFPALMALDPSTRHPRRVTTRYLGNRIGISGNEAIFDQIDVVREVDQQSDLYAVDIGSGDGGVRRLTFGARAADPDVSPDGAKLAFTVQSADRRYLATAARSPDRVVPVPLVSHPDVDFASPRWSPDGRSIAAERRVRGGASEIAIVDGATGDLRVLVPTGRNASPVWSPDGSTIFFASASDDEPFQIFSIPAAGGPVRRLEGTGSSAQSPALSPDGRLLVFVGYTADGYDLFSLPLSTARWTLVPAAGTAQPEAVESQPPAVTSTVYSPLRTLLPRFWTPTVESDEGQIVIGAATGSFDALGRHGYGAEAGWALSRGRPDWQLAYAYDRWRPTVFAVASDDTDPWRDGERRTIELDAGMILPSRRIRWSQTVLAALHASSERFDCESCAPAVDAEIRRRSIRTGLTFDRARMFGYSVSPEEGGTITTTLEYTRADLPERAFSPSATIDARYYVRAWPRHAAIAIRGAAAASWGDGPARRVFSASGSDAQPGGFRFGTDAIGLIRGVDADRVFGTRATVVNLDYRLPLAHVERGFGTLPVFLKNVHAAVFLDAGHAWTARFRSDDFRYSAGAELSIDTILGYVAPVTFSAGGAWRRAPDPHDRGFAAFVRVGRAF